jgi:hypothetical protein
MLDNKSHYREHLHKFHFTLYVNISDKAPCSSNACRTGEVWVSSKHTQLLVFMQCAELLECEGFCMEICVACEATVPHVYHRQSPNMPLALTHLFQSEFCFPAQFTLSKRRVGIHGDNVPSASILYLKRYHGLCYCLESSEQLEDGHALPCPQVVGLQWEHLHIVFMWFFGCHSSSVRARPASQTRLSTSPTRLGPTVYGMDCPLTSSNIRMSCNTDSPVPKPRLYT